MHTTQARFTGGGASEIRVGGGVMKRTIRLLGSAILVVSMSLLGVVSSTRAQSGCSLASFRGAYGVLVAGFFQQAGTTVASLPNTTIGLLTADGAGGFSGTSFTGSFNGTIQPAATVAGTYTVNPDCTGSLFATGSNGGTINFVIVARGSQLLAISTVAGSVESSIAILSPSALQISTFTTVDVPGSIETDAFGINNSGQISGDFADSTGREHGFLVAGGSFSTVDVPGSVQTFGRGINDRGQTVGNYLDSTFKRHGYLLSSGSFITFDFPGAIETRGVGINNSGAIVGRYRDTGGIHGYLLSSGTFTTIDFPCAIETRAFGINDVGQVVGRYRDSAGQFHSFLLGTDGFRVVDFPGATFTEADGINNRGEIVGDYEDAAGIFHGFLLSGGIFRTMDFPGAIETDPFGINDAGQIVGSYADSSGKFHGFLAHR